MIAILDDLGVDVAHLVGASMGGAVAQVVALEWPDRVQSLTMISSTPTGAEVAASSFDEGGPVDPSLPGPTPDLLVAMAAAAASKSASLEDELDASVETAAVLAGSFAAFDPERRRALARRERARRGRGRRAGTTRSR